MSATLMATQNMTSALPLEVSCQFMDSVYLLCIELGADPRHVSRDLPYSYEYLCDKTRWIDWPSFAVIMRRMVDEIGATEEEVVRNSGQTFERSLPRLVLNMLGLFASPSAVTRWYFGAQGLVHSYVRVFDTRFKEHPDGLGFEWSVELNRPELELTEVNFWGIRGQTQAAYRMLGAPDAVVTMTRLERGYHYQTRYSQRSLALQLRQRLGRPFRALRARRMLNETNLELLARLRQLETEVRRREQSEEALRRQMAEAETLQRQLSHSERLNSLGLIAGGVAHDFNNLLVAIMGHTGMLRLELEDPSICVLDDLDGLDEAASRARELTAQLLTFGRRQTLETAPLELGSELRRIWKMLARLLPSDIDAQLMLDAPLVVLADRSQLEQIVMNLVLNARDAMAEGGRLELQLSARELDSASAAEFEVQAGRFAQLRVTDTGSGISPEDHSRIFDPFFTTKPDGQGTGLGLSVVFGAVHRHEGFVTVRSELGRGTSFTVCLPLAEGQEHAHADVLVRGPAPGGHERVLFVDDHDLVRRIGAEILRGAGYEVELAADGVEALARLDGREFELVITDVVMPRLSGVELARKLQRERAQLRVLLSTGYATSREHLDELRAGGVPLLAKPFSPEQLLRAVRDALDV